LRGSKWHRTGSPRRRPARSAGHQPPRRRHRRLTGRRGAAALSTRGEVSLLHRGTEQAVICGAPESVSPRRRILRADLHAIRSQGAVVPRAGNNVQEQLAFLRRRAFIALTQDERLAFFADLCNEGAGHELAVLARRGVALGPGDVLAWTLRPQVDVAL